MLLKRFLIGAALGSPRTVLVEMAKRGDLNALRELVRNPGGVDINSISGARYLMEIPGR